MSRFRSILWQGAASAVLVIAEPTIAAQAHTARSLPHWMSRAQQRLGLDPAQQNALRLLADDNAAKMQALPWQPRPEEMANLQREFRVGLARILGPGQLAEWDLLLEELLGAAREHDAPAPAVRH